LALGVGLTFVGVEALTHAQAAVETLIGFGVPGAHGITQATVLKKAHADDGVGACRLVLGVFVFAAERDEGGDEQKRGESEVFHRMILPCVRNVGGSTLF
jgi:hypothetical protein